jgi:phospholipase C
VLTTALVPVTDFLAKSFCTCDRWFSPIPTSTQPNRTMAFCGYSPIYKTKTQLILIDDNIFKWMDANKFPELRSMRGN